MRSAIIVTEAGSPTGPRYPGSVPKFAMISSTVANRNPSVKGASFPTFTSLRSWSPRKRRRKILAGVTESVASTIDFTVWVMGSPRNSATWAQVLLPGVGTVCIGPVAGPRSASRGRPSASSILAA